MTQRIVTSGPLDNTKLQERTHNHPSLQQNHPSHPVLSLRKKMTNKPKSPSPATKPPKNKATEPIFEPTLPLTLPTPSSTDRYCCIAFRHLIII